MDKDILSKVDWNEYCKKLCDFEDRDDFSGALKYIDSMIEKHHLTGAEEKEYKDEVIRRRRGEIKEMLDESGSARIPAAEVRTGETGFFDLVIRPPKTHIDQFHDDRKEILKEMETQRSNEEAKKAKSKLRFWRKKKP